MKILFILFWFSFVCISFIYSIPISDDSNQNKQNQNIGLEDSFNSFGKIAQTVFSLFSEDNEIPKSDLDKETQVLNQYYPTQPLEFKNELISPTMTSADWVNRLSFVNADPIEYNPKSPLDNLNEEPGKQLQ
eukprot:c2501_g1_i1.p1 GENE.c2501_g1_i1~~c2501_g1_i1.p1  ORF type:complete len:145 (+),score=49.81 c2501_g1_i1:40-435(+)